MKNHKIIKCEQLSKFQSLSGKNCLSNKPFKFWWNCHITWKEFSEKLTKDILLLLFAHLDTIGLFKIKTFLFEFLHTYIFFSRVID